MSPATEKSSTAAGWYTIGQMRAWEKNPKKHPDSNVADIARSVRRFGFVAPVVVWGSRGQIVAGHGRYLAAQMILRADPGAYLATDAPGPALIPVRVVEFASDAEASAYALADNRLTEANPMEPLDVAAILKEISEAGGDVEVPGWTEAEIAAMLGGQEPEPEAAKESKYTSKITAPIYEPKGERPPVADLYDYSKSLELRKEIEAAGLPPEVAAFLRAAADRHTVFHYKRIAEFYAHASPEVQGLMERSALVIIDFDKAIENGFVRLSERLAELAGIEEDSDAG